MGSILILRTSPWWLPGSGNNLIFPMAIEWWKTAGHRHGYVNGHWMANHGWWVVGGLNMNNFIPPLGQLCTRVHSRGRYWPQ
jgi:hypothetical protein